MITWAYYFAFVNCFVVVFFISYLWTIRKETSIRIRNPPLLFISGIGSGLISVLSWFLADPNITYCHWEFSISVASFALQFFPTLLRGCQYVTLTNDKYRRKFPKFKSNTHLLKLWFIFFIFNSVILEILYYNFYIIKCHLMLGDGIYISLLLAIVVLGALRISFLVSWNSDAFNFARELKLCFLIWGIFGSAAIFTSLAEGLFENKAWKKATNVEVAIMSDLFFLVAIASPVTKSKSYRDKVSGTITKLCCSVSPQKAIEVSGFLKEAKIRKILPTNSSLILTGCAEKCGSSCCVLFEDILADEQTKRFFHEFSTRRFAAEISLFLEAVWEFNREMPLTDNSAKQYEQCLEIVSDFIKGGSPYEINISAAVKSQIFSATSSLENFEASITEGKEQANFCIFGEAVQAMVDLFENNFGHIFKSELSAFRTQMRKNERTVHVTSIFTKARL